MSIAPTSLVTVALSTYPSTLRWIAIKKEKKKQIKKKGLQGAMSIAPTSLVTVAVSTYPSTLRWIAKNGN